MKCILLFTLYWLHFNITNDKNKTRKNTRDKTHRHLYSHWVIGFGGQVHHITAPINWSKSTLTHGVCRLVLICSLHLSLCQLPWVNTSFPSLMFISSVCLERTVIPPALHKHAYFPFLNLSKQILPRNLIYEFLWKFSWPFQLPLCMELSLNTSH